MKCIRGHMALLLCIALALAGCDSGYVLPVVDDIGKRCSVDTDCQSGLCVKTARDSDRHCSADCMERSDCPAPDNWDCPAVATGRQVCTCKVGGVDSDCDGDEDCGSKLCPDGCCQDGACVKTPSLSACGAGGAACVACVSKTADTCAKGKCQCGTSEPCSGITDTCSGGACKCGSGPACTGTSDTCVKGACRCGNGPPCTSGTCKGGTCTTCTSKSQCDDKKSCTADACVKGACQNTIVVGHCLISGTCQVKGAVSAANPCLRCEPASATDKWSSAEGKTCDDKVACTHTDVCTGGICKGTAYTCDDKLACTTDTCDGKGGCTITPKSGYCAVAKACHADQAADPTNVCNTCDAKAAPLAWTTKACSDGLICTTDTCAHPGGCASTPAAGWCVIAGVCVADKAAHPSDKCKRCDTAISQTSWTSYSCNDSLSCTVDACDGKGGCTNAPMSGYCAVAKACHADKTADPANACNTCDAKAAPLAWTTKTCSDGLTCTTDTCAHPGGCASTPATGWCVISGACVADKAAHPSDKCKRCDTAASQASWTQKGCSDNLACTVDACDSKGGCTHTPIAGWCLIDGACHKDGTVDTAIPWRKCVAATSHSVWTMAGKVTTLAGSGAQGAKDGAAAQAQFYHPYDVAICSLGKVYIADAENHKVRVFSGGMIGTLAGSGTKGHQDGAQLSARFNMPTGIFVDNGCTKVYVADRSTQRIRLITGGVVSTYAGTSKLGSADGPKQSAQFNGAMDVALGPGGKLFVADTYNHKIRVVANGMVSTLAGDGTVGLVNGSAASARFNHPQGIFVDGAGKVYVADTLNSVIRLISGGQVSTLAGDGTKGLVNGPAGSARFNLPQGVAVDGKGLVYVGDRSNHAVRFIAAGNVYTLAGGQGFADGDLKAARFSYPAGVAVTGKNLYVADRGNHRIRRIYW